MFEYSIPYLKQAGIKEYLLEVLQHNTGAVSVYKKIGFEVSREFYYFRPKISQIMTEVKGVGFPYTIQPIDINKHDSIPSFWDFKPSWQNSMDSVNRSSEGFIGLGVFTDNKLIGYGIFEPASGDITQIAVDKTYRRKGVGSLLFHNMIKANKLDSIKT